MFAVIDEFKDSFERGYIFRLRDNNEDICVMESKVDSSVFVSDFEFSNRSVSNFLFHIFEKFMVDKFQKIEELEVESKLYRLIQMNKNFIQRDSTIFGVKIKKI